MDLFSSPKHFQDVFRAGLAHLVGLPQATPGQLVLVLANAIVLKDSALLDAVRQRAQPLLGAAADQDPNEDLQVLSLVLGADDPFNLILHRATPRGYQIQFNQLRALRPRREARAPATTISRPFDPVKFNFTRIPDEAYWHGELWGRPVACYYNKYPFEPYHTSVVPEPDAGRAQFLARDQHQLAWDFRQILATSAPNAVLAYNSLGAYASVNHLHFQMIPDGGPLPLVQAQDPSAYPVPHTAHPDPEAAWAHIETLQAANQPFNLMYLPGRIVVVPRRFQGSHTDPAWTTGFAWYELSGGIIAVDHDAYKTLTDEQIESEYHQVTGDIAAEA